MIKFDKMKLITDIDYISNIDNSVFLSVTKFDEVLYYKYQQDKPYSLLIMVDYAHNELVLEFTGKILLNEYPCLINKDTIKTCIDNINKLGICNLNRDLIINNSRVIKCDVTKDIECNMNLIIPSVRQNIVNYSKWTAKPYSNGLILENVVSTPRYKKRLAIYDKRRELEQGNSKHFISNLSNGNELLDYFKDKVRFELNLNTMYQIRQLLNIPDNNIQSVLNSTANPILSVIDEAVKYKETKIRAVTLRDYEHELLMKECDYDLTKVEAKVRAYSKKSTSISRAMKPYKDLFHQLKYDKNTELDIRKLVC